MYNLYFTNIFIERNMKHKRFRDAYKIKTKKQEIFVTISLRNSSCVVPYTCAQLTDSSKSNIQEMTRKKQLICVDNEILNRVVRLLRISSLFLPCSSFLIFQKRVSVRHCFENHNIDMKETKEENSSNSISKSNNEIKKRSMKWTSVLFYIYLHVFGLAGLYFLFIKAKWMTVFYFLFLVTSSSIGLTAGAHRYYAHQTFVATWQFRLFIMLAHTIAGVGSIYDWVFWHRIHHKFYGTDRDPYNHKRGFFYSHVVSNLLSAPFDLKTYARDIDMRDVDEDGYIWTQRKFYWILFIVLGLLLPIHAAVVYWDESYTNSFLIIGAARLLITTNISWLINSALLVWGLNKGDKFPVDDNSVFFLSKSYWLNYHYMLPWDWKNDEFGTYEAGFITFTIKICRELGFINQLKTATCDDVREALYKVASSEMTMDEALAEIKQNAEEVACKEKLIYRH